MNSVDPIRDKADIYNFLTILKKKMRETTSWRSPDFIQGTAFQTFCT